MMKFEDLLMQPNEEKERRKNLEEEVEKLRQELDAGLQLKTVLQCALEGPVHSCPCLSSFLPPTVQVLLSELAMVEEEINWLERKVDDLKLNLYREKQQTKEWEMLQLSKEWETMLPPKEMQPRREQRQLKHLLPRRAFRKEVKDSEISSKPPIPDDRRRYRILRRRRASIGSSSDLPPLPSGIEETAENSTSSRRSFYRSQTDTETDMDHKPTQLSEELIKSMIDVFLRLNQASESSKGTPVIAKNALPRKNTKTSNTRNSLSFTAPTFASDFKTSNLDPYGISSDMDDTIRDVGPYKNFIQITRSSLKLSNSSECPAEMGKLRALIQKLSNVDLTYFTYKQKLAFWINVHNAIIMHAFLQYGLPSTEEDQLALMNKAAINVGGIMLNALAIEHFILRHPSESEHVLTDEREMFLRSTYGLGYPEPNVTFALCRGSWSSPALRIYTPDDVVNELEKAKVDYLEAAVGVTSKKKILIPKLMEWHLRDFADGMEALVEWIYSQLPQSCPLKRLIIECLDGDAKSAPAKIIDVQPFNSEFRYMLPL